LTLLQNRLKKELPAGQSFQDYIGNVCFDFSFCSISSYNYCTFFTKKLKEILVLLPIVRHFLKVKRSLSEDKYPKKDYTIFENQKRRELL
jgi:hypothetical protein